MLAWCDAWLIELRGHGDHARMGDAERVLFASLAAVTTINIAKWQPDGRGAQLRVVDLSKANIFKLFEHPLYPGRDVQMLFRYIYDVRTEKELGERLRADPIPLRERVMAAGVELDFARHSLVFKDFITRIDAVDAISRVEALIEFLLRLQAVPESQVQNAMHHWSRRVLSSSICAWQ